MANVLNLWQVSEGGISDIVTAQRVPLGQVHPSIRYTPQSINSLRIESPSVKMKEYLILFLFSLDIKRPASTKSFSRKKMIFQIWIVNTKGSGLRELFSWPTFCWNIPEPAL